MKWPVFNRTADFGPIRLFPGPAFTYEKRELKPRTGEGIIPCTFGCVFCWFEGELKLEKEALPRWQDDGGR